MMPTDAEQPHINNRTLRLNAIYRNVLLLFVLFSVGVVIWTSVQVVHIANYLAQQQEIEVSYLQCVSKIPPEQRTLQNTQACFKLPPKEIKL